MNPLEQLKDIHAAPDPGWWPLAPGWWVLLAVLVLVSLAVIVIYRRYRAYQHRRAVLNEFEAVYTRYQSNPDRARLAAGLHRLIRRLMLATGAHQQLGLTGEAFLGYLDDGLEGQPFREGAGTALLQAPYQRQADFDAEDLHQKVMLWARQQVRRLV